MNPKGKLFVFEGTDAAGKSSISARFVDWLRSQGKTVEPLSFPGKSPGTIGDLVYRIHHDRAAFGLNPLTESSLQTLHIAAHLDAIESRIIPSLEAGKTVVLDRYWWSTRVYGVVGGARAEVLDKLIEAEQIAWGDWLPTALFCIGRSTPLRDEPMDRWSRWKDGYDEMLRRESGRYPIHSIQNESSIDDCVSEIIRYCSPLA
jgi:thymidylate kinase